MQSPCIAMESTGVYWIPLFELLERRGFEVLLVEPSQIKKFRRKTDVLDCQWIQTLHTFSLLTGSFRPTNQIITLRNYMRQREMLVKQAAQHVQHMQKAMEQMNLKLTEVISDITGVTGLSIIDAILGGQRDPHALAKLRHDRCSNDEPTIDGIAEHSALQIVSEIGLDMEAWPTEKHFVSWLSLCPELNKSGGRKQKKGKSRTHRSGNRVAQVLRVCAQTLIRSKCALGAFARRLKSRDGSPSAITAVARKLAIIVYTMLKTGRPYVDTGAEAYDARYRERMVLSLRRRAEQLGFELSPGTAA